MGMNIDIKKYKYCSTKKILQKFYECYIDRIVRNDEKISLNHTILIFTMLIHGISILQYYYIDICNIDTWNINIAKQV